MKGKGRGLLQIVPKLTVYSGAVFSSIGMKASSDSWSYCTQILWDDCDEMWVSPAPLLRHRAMLMPGHICWPKIVHKMQRQIVSFALHLYIKLEPTDPPPLNC